MKTHHIYKLSLACIFCLSLATTAQAKEPLEKGFTLKFCYLMPNSDYGLFSINDPDNPFDNYPLTSANPGFGLNIGTMYYINAIDLGDQMKIGVDVTWLSFNYQTTSHDFFLRRTDETAMSTTTAFHTGDFDMTHLSFYAEVGPMFSYSPVDKLALDASFKFSPVLDLAAGSYDLPINGGQKETVTGRGFGFRMTPAFYVRYSVFLVGIEYNIGNLGYKYQGAGGAFSNEQSLTVPNSTTRILLGFKF